MSMIMRGNSRKTEPSLPRASNVPTPSTPAVIYDEEAIRRYQKDVERERMLLQLEQERNEWKHKCLGAEEDNRRLESRLDRDTQAHTIEIANLTDQRDRKIEELTQQRDQYKLKLARFETKIAMIGDALYKLANTTAENVSKLLEEIRTEQGKPDDAGSVASLAAVAEAIAFEDPATPQLTKS
jgi:chromosome segregation ATPase